MNPVVDPAAGVDRAFLYIIGFSLALLFGITLMMIVFVIRYRRSRNPNPVDIRGHTGLEIVWMTIPTLIALSMFYVGWDAYTGLRNVPEGALQVKVSAEMFTWQFAYPNGKVSENLMVVPQGKPVKLLISSKDVIHSFFAPAFRIKVDALKGMETYAWFVGNRPGTFNIFCTEFCGSGHSDMIADLKVVPQAEYDAWLARKEEEPAGATAGGVSPEVRKIFEDLSAFHKIEDKMTFFWKVDGELLHCKLSAHTEGWVAVGFNPSQGMKGANFILAYVKNGKVFATDHFGTTPVKHEPDEKLGGKSDIANVFGSESNGVTEVCFSIPLKSGDAADQGLDLNGDTTVLLAYNAGMDDFRTKHNYRNGFLVNLTSGEVKPMSQRPAGRKAP